MGCRIFVGKEAGCDPIEEQAVFFDSVTGTAFGPIMESHEVAEAFMRYLAQHPVHAGRSIMGPTWQSDPRLYSEAALADNYAAFLSLKTECAHCHQPTWRDESAAPYRDLCAECAKMAEEEAAEEADNADAVL